jgi:NADH:ubiquinone oxidoreductase subunit
MQSVYRPIYREAEISRASQTMRIFLMKNWKTQIEIPIHWLIWGFFRLGMAIPNIKWIEHEYKKKRNEDFKMVSDN